MFFTTEPQRSQRRAESKKETPRCHSGNLDEVVIVRNPAFKSDQSFNAGGRRNAASQALSQRAAEKILDLGESTTPTTAIFFHHRATEVTEESFNLGNAQVLQKR